jgi:hypothetical protein
MARTAEEKARHERTEQIGDLGETFLSQLCQKGGLISNKSLEKDAAGWDHIIEFPYDTGLAKEQLHVDALKCKVQVKSTDNEKQNSYSFKLSSIRRLVTDPLPTFILFVHFNKQEDPEEVFLVHVGERIIGDVLREITEIEAENEKLDESEKVELHIKKIPVKYSSEDKLPKHDSSTFKQKIKDYIQDTHKYAKWKTEFLENVGFESDDFGFFKMNKISLDEMAKLQLGLIDFLELEDSSMIGKSRFGLEPKVTNNSGGRIQYKGKEYKGTLTLPDNSTFKIKYYMSSIDSSMISPQTPNTRILSEHFDFTTNIKSGYTKMFIPPWLEKVMTFSDLKACLQLYTLFNENKPFYAQLYIPELEIESPFTVLDCDFTINLHEAVENFAKLEKIYQYFSINTFKESLALSELYNDKAETLGLFDSFITGGKIDFPSIGEVNEKYCILNFVSFGIANRIFMICYQVKGQTKEDGFKIEDAEIFGSEFSEVQDLEPLHTFHKKSISTIQENYESTSYIVKTSYMGKALVYNLA